MATVLASISTKGRYDTTLPLAIQAIIAQTRKVDKLIIFDDNDQPKDMREVQHYQYLYDIMNYKGIAWEWCYALKKGQHHNHQMANKMGFDWVWRVDDDCIPEPNVLENLMAHIGPDIGGVAGSILTPPFPPVVGATGKIENIYSEPNIQWDYIKEKQEVDHLHCSFLYRAGVYDYNLTLSRVAHREETLFTYGLRQLGYKLLLIPNAVTWHLKNKFGGIRTETKELFEHDEHIFQNYMKFRDNTIVVLDCGMGDHLVFKRVLPEIKNPILYTCYPEIIPGRSIAEAQQTFGSLDQFNIYKKMDEWNWRDSLENAYRKMYVLENKEAKKFISNPLIDLRWLKEKNVEIFNEVIEVNEYGISREDIQDKNVIDVGANVGMFSIFSAYLGAKKILCAEPSSNTFKQLTENIAQSKYKNIFAFNNAVSDVAGKEIKISMLDNSGHNSVYSDAEEYETIKTLGLMDLLNQVEGDTVLKIDCEGSEYDILMNIEQHMLDKVVALHIEIHEDLHPVYKGFEVMENKILSLGFTKVRDRQMNGYVFNDNHQIVQSVPLPTKLCYFEKVKV